MCTYMYILYVYINIYIHTRIHEYMYALTFKYTHIFSKVGSTIILSEIE